MAQKIQVPNFLTLYHQEMFVMVNNVNNLNFCKYFSTNDQFILLSYEKIFPKKTKLKYCKIAIQY